MARSLQNISRLDMDWSSNRYFVRMMLALFCAIGFLQHPVFAQDSEAPDWPDPRVGMCSATLGDTLYLIGGAQSVQGRNFANLTGTSTVEAFNLSTETWITSIAPLETPRVFACAAALNDSIYVMGGVDSLGHVLNSVEVYDPAENRWHYTSSMKFARKGAAAVAYGDYILVFGGGDAMNVLHREVESYSPQNGIWRVLKEETLLGRAFHHVAKIGNSVYIFGGLGATIGPVGIIEKYIPSVGVVSVGLSWRTRAFFGAVTRSDSVVVISGYGESTNGSGYLTNVDMLEFDNPDSVVERNTNKSLDDPRRGFVAAAGNGGKIYIFGGISPDYKSGLIPVASVATLENVVTAVAGNNIKPVPAGFKLDQNYPNPFNPTTNIFFEVPSPGSRVRLDVYNIIGQRVATLVDGFRYAGSYSVTFNGANMPSGAYIYRLETENGSIFRKMVLIK